MSTVDLKKLVNQLDELVMTQVNDSPETLPDYIKTKDSLLDSIIETASAMKKWNRAYPYRHKEDFTEREAMAESVAKLT